MSTQVPLTASVAVDGDDGAGLLNEVLNDSGVVVLGDPVLSILHSPLAARADDAVGLHAHLRCEDETGGGGE